MYTIKSDVISCFVLKKGVTKVKLSICTHTHKHTRTHTHTHTNTCTQAHADAHAHAHTHDMHTLKENPRRPLTPQTPSMHTTHPYVQYKCIPRSHGCCTKNKEKNKYISMHIPFWNLRQVFRRCVQLHQALKDHHHTVQSEKQKTFVCHCWCAKDHYMALDKYILEYTLTLYRTQPHISPQGHMNESASSGTHIITHLTCTRAHKNISKNKKIHVSVSIKT